MKNKNIRHCDPPAIRHCDPPTGGEAIPMRLLRRLELLAMTGEIAMTLITTFLISSQKIFAQHFESDSFIIDMGNFNMTSGRKSSTTYRLSDTVGEMTPGRFDSTGYIVKSGFQYIHDILNVFSFRIDDLSIDLGVLIPSIGSTDTNTITITTPFGKGYQIMAHENKPLSLDTGISIPDTSCNDGCTESLSRPWTSATAYGFGFNAIGINSSGVATGIGTSDYFLDETYYRQFANYTANPPETNQIIMSENSSVKNRSARISYKALISTVQAGGNYENSIIFTAVPKY